MPITKSTYVMLASTIGECINIDSHKSRETSLNIYNSTFNTGKLLEKLKFILAKDNPKFDVIKFEEAIKTTYTYKLDDRVERLKRANLSTAGYTP